jgi:hypothetical protein
VTAAGAGVARLPRTAIVHGEARPCDVRLSPGVTFRAVVVDARTGAPVPGVSLHGWDQAGAGRTDVRGELAITGVTPGRFVCSVAAPGYGRWWSDACASDWLRHQPSHKPGSNWQRNFDQLDFNVRPGMGPVRIVVERGVRVRGRVIDPDGRPVAGAAVVPALTGGDDALGERFRATTGPDGGFALDLPASGAATYRLEARDGSAVGASPPLRTTPGQEVGGVTVALSAR